MKEYGMRDSEGEFERRAMVSGRRRDELTVMKLEDVEQIIESALVACGFVHNPNFK